MTHKKRSVIASLGLAFLLVGCGEPAPAAFNANLDIDCKPHDFIDKIQASLSAEDFWRAQEYDMGLMMTAGQKNLSLSRDIFETSQAQKGQYFNRAQQAARDLGLSGKAQREHVKENMDRYDAEVKEVEERIRWQQDSLAWVRKCTSVVNNQLRQLGLQPVTFDPTQKPS